MFWWRNRKAEKGKKKVSVMISGKTQVVANTEGDSGGKRSRKGEGERERKRGREG